MLLDLIFAGISALKEYIALHLRVKTFKVCAFVNGIKSFLE